MLSPRRPVRVRSPALHRLATRDGNTLHRFDDASVPSAATHVAGELFADLKLSWFGRALEQRMRRHDQARRAEPTLHSASIDKRLLHIAWRTDGRNTLDGDNALVDCASGQHKATADQLVVNEHAARAALALLARPFATQQTETFAQHKKQALAQPRVAHGAGLAIHMEFVLLVQGYRLTHGETPFVTNVMQGHRWRGADTRR